MMQEYPIEKKTVDPAIVDDAVAPFEALPAYSAQSMSFTNVAPSGDQERDFEAGLFDCCSAGHRMGLSPSPS